MRPVVLPAALSLFIATAICQSPLTQQTAGRQAGIAAFEAILPVLRHPRCMVCHSSGDYPRQGDDLHQHLMNVRRGNYGLGAAPVYCSSCHQDHNLEGTHMPPGAPGWHLPSAQQPMIWEGLSDRRLCELLVDPERNGGRDAKGIEAHMHTPLVQWGWHPGGGREPVPGDQNAFMHQVRVWTAAGDPCPAP
jgi:hypothetical protein